MYLKLPKSQAVARLFSGVSLDGSLSAGGVIDNFDTRLEVQPEYEFVTEFSR